MKENIVCNTITMNTDTNTDEQKLREDLIQRATTRLRHRLLEQGLQDVLHQVVSLQSELESLRLDAAATLDSVSNIQLNDTSEDSAQKLNRQMNVLERRFDAHKSKLFSLKEQQQEQPIIEESAADETLTPYSMSRLSSLSLMSSLFTRSNGSSRATSISGDEKKPQHQHSTQIYHDEDHPFYDLAGKRSFGAGSFCGSVYGDDQPTMEEPALVSNSIEVLYKRRQRRQRYQQQYLGRHDYSDNDSVVSDDSSVSSLSNIVLSTASAYHNDHIYLQHPLTPTTPPPCYYFDQPQYCQPWIRSLYDDHGQLDMKQHFESLYPQRNVLDDTMSFLDGISENGDDGGFGEDVYFLLQNPDLWCRSFSEIKPTIDKLRRQEQHQVMLNDVIQLLKPTTWVQLGMKYSGAMLYDVTCTSLEWCRFLSVLSAAVVISLMKGPEDMKSRF